MNFYCNSCLCELLTRDDERQSQNMFKGYLTKCFHIFCGNCVQKLKPYCGHCYQFTEFRAIDKNMPPNMRQLFEPLENQFKKVCTTIEFQTNLWDISYNRMRNGYSKLKQKGCGFKRKDRELAEENHAIESEIRKMMVMDQKYKEFRNRNNRDQRAAEKRSPKRSQESELSQNSQGMRRFIVQPSDFKDAEPISPRRLRVSSSFSEATEKTMSSRRPSPKMVNQQSTANRRPSGERQCYAYAMNERELDSGFSLSTH